VMLEQEGFKTVQALDGKSGYERALTLKPDLLVVDLRLPGMSGMQICKQLRASQIQTPITVLSAAGEEVDTVLLLEIGADGYVTKPFGRRELAGADPGGAAALVGRCAYGAALFRRGSGYGPACGAPQEPGREDDAS